MSRLRRGLTFGGVALGILAGAILGLVMSSNVGWTPSLRADPPAPFWSEGKGKAPAVQAPSFADLAEELSPAVVNISIATVLKEGKGTMGGMEMGPDSPFREFFGDDFMKRFFQEGQRGRPFKQRSLGSGFIVTPDGYIVTNHHVIAKADEIVVILNGGEEFKARVVGQDEKTDLALLKVDSRRDLPVCRLGDSDSVRVGDWVLAIGNPFGLGHTVTAGIVSAKGRDLGAGAYDDFIQTDAPINPGNSGGPLFDTAGNVVGINTAIIPGGGGGIGFAIPVSLAKSVLAQLRDNKKVVRAWLGVTIQPVTQDIAESLSLPGRKGALVADVIPRGPADKAGIRRRDLILSFNGREVKGAHELPSLVAYLPVGTVAEVELLREGKRKTVKVRLEEMKDEELAALGEEEGGSAASGDLGFTVAAVTPELARHLGIRGRARGVAVTSVDDGTPAAEANLRPGDLILEFDQAETPDLPSFEKAVEKAKGKSTFLLLVSRGGRTLFVTLKR